MPPLLLPLPSALPSPSAVAAILADSYGADYDHLGEILTPTTILPIARQLARLRGPAFPAPDGSTNAADMLALGSELALSRALTIATLGEAFPDTVSAPMLAPWEAMLGLINGASLTDDARRTRLLARWRTRFAGTPQAILSALTPLNGNVAPTMRETLARDSRANPKRVFVFTIRTPIDPNSPAIAPLDDVVQVMKPAHTASAFTNKSLTTGFFCNDADSLTNNTVL